MPGLFPVYIEREPLEAMFAAASEVYNRECYGYLLGHAPSAQRPYWLITSVHVAGGVTRRSQKHIATSHVSERRLRRFWKAMGQKLIGDFHSHTAYRTSEGVVRRPNGLSETDIESMAKGPADLPPPPLSALISIAPHDGKLRPWRLKARHTRLYGSTSDYTYGLSIYTLVGSEQGEQRSKRLVLQMAPSTRRALKRAYHRSSR